MQKNIFILFLFAVLFFVSNENTYASGSNGTASIKTTTTNTCAGTGTNIEVNVTGITNGSSSNGSCGYTITVPSGWTVSPQSGSGSGSDYNGDKTHTITPPATAAAGVYNYTLSVSTGSSGTTIGTCTVKRAPTVSVTAPFDICSGSKVSPDSPLVNQNNGTQSGSSWQWSSSSGGEYTDFTPSSKTWTNDGSTDQTYYLRYYSHNECGYGYSAVSPPVSFAVKPAPALSISSPMTVDCGASVELPTIDNNGSAINWYADAACNTSVATNLGILTSNSSTFYALVSQEYEIADGGEEEIVETYSYKGYEESLVIPAGVESVKLEVWGAQGGKAGIAIGGKGGYSVGTMSVTPGQTLYINVGGKGNGSDSGEERWLSGGYNGGGEGKSEVTDIYGAGGGATHIAIASGLLKNLSGNPSSVLIVAGGGGGGCYNNSLGYFDGGSGGGTNGGKNGDGYNPGGGGTQSGGGTNPSSWGGWKSASFGEGGGHSGSTAQVYSAGGGGYYGGGYGSPGGGGSGYKGSLHSASTSNGVREGDGYAKITMYKHTPSIMTCESTVPASVIVNPAQVSLAEISDKSFCTGGSIDITASASSTNSTTPSYAYSWSDGINTTNGATVTASAAGTYTYIVTATLNGNAECTATAFRMVRVTENTPNVANVSSYDYIWKGGTTDWNTADNWYIYNSSSRTYSVASAPLVATKNYYIGTGDCLPTNQWPIINTDATVDSLTIALDASLTIQANKTLNIKGNLTNDGTLSADNNSIVDFNGTSTQIVRGETAFGKVTFDNENGIILGDNIEVKTLANFIHGIVNGNMTFGSSASANGASTGSYVDGFVTKAGALSGFTFPTGNDGVLGTITATSTLPATVRFNNFASSGDYNTESDMCDGPNALNHVSRYEYWDINNTADLTDVTLYSRGEFDVHFNPATSNRNVNNIKAAIYRNGCWENIGGTADISGSSNEILSVSNVTIPGSNGRTTGKASFGSLNQSTLLPIELLSFNATCNRTRTHIAWTTATEKNNDYFSLERSDDAVNFTEIARVAGAGNSIEPIDYSYTDYGIHGGDNYYRLVQVDYDGTRTVSEIVVANCIEPEVGEPDVQAYPNPFSSELTVVLDNFGNRAATIEVYDMLGKLIYTNKVAASQNSYETVLNLSNLPPAAYTVRVSTNDFVINRNVVKQ